MLANSSNIEVFMCRILLDMSCGGVKEQIDSPCLRGLRVQGKEKWNGRLLKRT